MTFTNDLYFSLSIRWFYLVDRKTFIFPHSSEQKFVYCISNCNIVFVFPSTRKNCFGKMLFSKTVYGTCNRYDFFRMQQRKVVKILQRAIQKQYDFSRQKNNVKNTVALELTPLHYSCLPLYITLHTSFVEYTLWHIYFKKNLENRIKFKTELQILIKTMVK